MNESDLVAALSVNPWYCALAPSQRRAMVQQSELVRLRPGEMLFRQGDPPGGFYALVGGTLKASSVREDGREAILAVLETGTWFGEISLIDNLPRTHDATAIGQVAVLALPRPAFDRLMQDADFARAIAAMLAARVRLLYGMVEDATLRSTRARVARRLLLLARGDAAMDPSMRPRVPVSQEGLAMMLGITRQTLSRELGKMVQQQLVLLGYGYIEIVSEDGLRQLTHRA